METLEFARQFVKAIEAGDVEAVRACYAPDARIWHNFDDAEQSVDENVALLAWMVRKAKGRRYEITRLEEIPGGYLQQHLLRLETASGEELVLPACVVVTLEGGRIRRLEEYIDPAPVARLR